MTLPTVLRLNATSCLLFGLLFTSAPEETSAWLGNSAPDILRWVGVALIFNGLHLLFAARRPRVSCPELVYFVIGDFAWVGATAVLLLLRVGATTPFGIGAAILVAAMVGTFGYWQFSYARLACTSRTL